MKNFTRPTRLLPLLAALALAWPLAAQAGSTDVDLFTSGGNVEPNIVILLDNSGSMDRGTDNLSGCNATDATASNACRRIIASEAVKALVNKVNPYDPPPGPGQVRALPRLAEAPAGLPLLCERGPGLPDPAVLVPVRLQ